MKAFVILDSNENVRVILDKDQCESLIGKVGVRRMVENEGVRYDIPMPKNSMYLQQGGFTAIIHKTDSITYSYFAVNL
jgi:hypothetical protein